MEKDINYHMTIWECINGCKARGGVPFQFVACSPANCGAMGKLLPCPKCHQFGLKLLKQNPVVHYTTKFVYTEAAND